MKASYSAFIVLLAFYGLVPGCKSSSTFEGECKRDTDCAQYERCDTRDYRCVCKSDEACAPGEICNAGGSCQRKTECFSNYDCAAGTVCDIDSGECIGSNSCTTDFQCEIGQICENNLCRLGCRETADCDLEKREVCVSGECRLGLCESNSYCEFGDVCEAQTHACVAPQDPHCVKDCSPTCDQCGEDTGIGPCNDPANVCVRSGNTAYCWVACTTGEECPSGYQCVPTTVSWGPVCQNDADCTSVPAPDDRVINVCDGTNGGQNIGRCRLNKQPCWTDADCYPFVTTCLAQKCIFAYHCRPPEGCQ